MIVLNYMTDRNLYQILNIILSIYEKHGEKTYDYPIRICKIKIENRITFKKTGYYFEPFTPETMKLLTRL